MDALVTWSTLKPAQWLAQLDVGCRAGGYWASVRTAKWAVNTSGTANICCTGSIQHQYAGSTNTFGGTNAHGTWSSARIAVACGPRPRSAARKNSCVAGKGCHPHHQTVAIKGIHPDRYPTVGVKLHDDGRYALLPSPRANHLWPVVDAKPMTVRE